MHQAEVLTIPADSAELGRGRRPMTCPEPHSRLSGTHESEAIDMSLNQDQKQPTAAHHHQRIKSSSSALSLLAKYGLTDHDDGTNMYGHKLGQHIIEHDHAKDVEHFADDGEIMLLNHDQINGSTCTLPLHEKYNYFASHNVDNSQHDRHAQQYTAGGVNEARSHHNIQAASADHHRKKVNYSPCDQIHCTHCCSERYLKANTERLSIMHSCYQSDNTFVTGIN